VKSLNSTELQLFEKSPLVDLFEKSRAESIGDLEDGSQYSLGQGIKQSAFTCVHRRPSILCLGSAKRLKKLSGRR
jgi:hypothetical protein